jgi:hypothetical protein
MKKTVLLILLLQVGILLKAQEPAYKAMMNDSRINFYQVCDSAEAYFMNIDKEKKGSGYKPFLRWKHENESKYFPSGNRMVDKYLPHKEYERMKVEQAADQTQQRLFLSGGWQSLGPDTIGTITGHYAPGLGRVEYVEVNKLNAQQIYMGSRSGGLWSTINGGATWSHNTDFLPASGVDVISASPTNFDSVLINVRNAQNGTSFGIYRSIDGGINFVPTPFNYSNPTLGFGGLGSDFKINVIKYHPRVPNLIFVGTDRGVFRSTDNLQTWVRLNNSWDVKDIEFHPINNSIIYLYEYKSSNGNRNKIFKSINQGLGYSALLDLPGNGGLEINISVSPTCPSCIFATSNNGIWKSYNEGLSFSTTVSPAPAGISLWYATPNDLDTSKFVGGYLDVFRSTNGGLSFNKASWWSLGSAQHGGANNQSAYNSSNVYIHADCNYLTCVNGAYYACTDGFLCKSIDNGLTWQKLSLSTGIRENYNLGVSQSNHYRTICGSQDNGTSIKTENGWIEFYGADGMEGLIHPLNDNWMIGSSQNGGRRRTLDGGTTQNGVTQPQSGAGNAYWIAPIMYDPNNHMNIYSFAKNVFKSNDFGSSWTMLGAPTTFTDVIKFATIAENNSNIMVITNDDKIELSTNGGVSFTNIKSNLPNNSITDVVFDPNKDSTIIVTYDTYQNNGQKVFITKNLGTTWQNITYNLGNMPVLSVIVDHTDSSNIYLGASIGIYKKSMNANVWSLYNPNFPNVAVKEMEINYGSNTLKAATWGRGLWEFALADRNTYPAIIKTSLSEAVTFTTPKSTVDQFVTSEINYTGSVLSSVFVRWAVNSPAFTLSNSIPMSLVSGNTWKSNTPLPDFPAGTKVFFKVYAVGQSADTTETYKFMYELKPFQYCTATASTDGNNMHINRFTLANVNNVTTNTTNTFYSILPIILYRDSTYNATGRFNQAFSGQSDFHVWIDYNRDAVFTSNENVVTKPNFTFTAPNLLAGANFTVPSNAILDTVLLRARYAYYGDGDDPCGSNLGEIEEYPVIIRQAPTIEFNGNTSFCAGSNLNLSYTGTAVDSVKWILSNGINTYTMMGSTVNANTFNAGIYSVSVNAYKYGEAFTKNTPNYFVINALPVVSANPSVSAICEGQSTVLTGGGALNYVWNNGVTDGVSFSPSTTSIYSVTGTDANGCIGTASTTITVNAQPSANLPVTISTCNATEILDAGNPSLPGVSYLWSNGATTQSITVSTNGIYSVMVTGNGGCLVLDTTNVTLNSGVANSNISATSTTICECASTTLIGSPSGGTFSANGIGGVFNGTTPGTYEITYAVTSTCGTAIDTVSILVNANPAASLVAAVSVLCAGTPTVLTGLPVGGTYSVVTGAANVLSGNTFNATNTGNYTIAYTVSNSAGCSDSAQFNLEVNCVLGLNQSAINNSSFIISPNPNNGQFAIRSNIEIEGTIELINELGQILFISPMNGNFKLIEAMSLANGMYHLRINSKQGAAIIKVSLIK